MKYNEIMKDFDYHFKNCYISNFDLIHNECRGDKLNFSRRFYETITYSDVKKKLSTNFENKFISSAIKSERKDLHIEKKIITENFRTVEEIKEKFESKGIFLSSMRKRFYCKKTDNCKSLKY